MAVTGRFKSVPRASGPRAAEGGALEFEPHEEARTISQGN